VRPRLVTLGQADWPRLRDLIDPEVPLNIFLASRVAQFGLDPARLGCAVLGFERRGRLVAALHCGANLFLLGDDEEAMDAFVDQLGPRIHTQSVVGPAGVIPEFHRRLVRRWGGSWGSPRSVREHQPIMVLDGNPLVAPDMRVHPITLEEADPYFQAAVSMYTEEVGGSPLDATNSYRFYIHSLIRSHRAFGAVTDGHAWFKADIGSTYGRYCQVQGVWLAPALRGRGLAEPAMAQAVVLARRSWPVVTLYVNDYNVRAVRVYLRLGFTIVGELATILF